MDHSEELREFVEKLFDEWENNWLAVHSEWCGTPSCTGASIHPRKGRSCEDAREYRARVAVYRRRLDELLKGTP